MKISQMVAMGAFCLGAGLPAMAQNQTQAQTQAQTPPPLMCETDPAFRDFDFWLGDWRVTATQGGQFAGTNRITKVENSCLIREEWTSVGNGGTGQSINYYNPLTKKWRQVWVSGGAGGYSIDYEGGLKEGSMVMEGTIYYYAQATEFPFRGTWTPNEDGTVRQFFEQFDPEANQWNPWFDGLYVRAEKSQ